jgi:protease IV
VSRKRLVALIGAGVIFVGFVVLAGGLTPEPIGDWQESTLRGEGPDKIAVVNLRGEIVSQEAEAFARGTSAADLVSQLRQAREDDAVLGVMVRIDTPGGSVVASDTVRAELDDLREAEKPVVAYLEETAASGGYFIASGADRIVANRATITGSIGVIIVLLNVQEAADKLGVEPIIIKSGPHKDMGSPFRDMTPEERRMLIALIDEAHEQFVDVIVEGRDLSRAEVERLADGRIISGAQAVDEGLVDELGTFDDAADTLAELVEVEDPRVVEYGRPPSLMDLLFDLGLSRDPVEQVRRSFGAHGPILKYLYVP